MSQPKNRISTHTDGVARVRLGNNLDAIELARGMTREMALRKAKQALNDALIEVEDALFVETGEVA